MRAKGLVPVTIRVLTVNNPHFAEEYRRQVPSQAMIDRVTSLNREKIGHAVGQLQGAKYQLVLRSMLALIGAG